MTAAHRHHRQYSGLGPIFRADSGSWSQPNNGNMELQTSYMEKRQVFLRSYQFSRKQSLRERIKQSFIRLKRTLCVRLRSARRIRKVVWSGLRFALYNKRRRLARIMNYYYFHTNKNSASSTNYNYYEQLFYKSPAPTSCLW